jgi:hypothetical protein
VDERYAVEASQRGPAAEGFVVRMRDHDRNRARVDDRPARIRELPQEGVDCLILITISHSRCSTHADQSVSVTLLRPGGRSGSQPRRTAKAFAIR